MDHKQLKLKLTPEQHKQFYMLCIAHGTSMNAVMREAIEKLLSDPPIDGDLSLDLTLQAPTKPTAQQLVDLREKAIQWVNDNYKDPGFGRRSGNKSEVWKIMTHDESQSQFAEVPMYPNPFNKDEI